MTSESEAVLKEGRGFAGIFVAPNQYRKTITMRTIAEEAGVSQGAVSSLVNDRDYGIRVGSKTRNRVFKICRRLGYVPNDFRAVVRIYPEVGDICVLVSDSIESALMEPFYARLISSLLQSGRAKKGNVTMARFDSAKDYSESLDDLPLPIKSGVASQFISIGEPNPSLIETILNRELPVVTVGHELVQPGVTSLLPDFAQALRIGIEYLLMLKHEKIAVLIGSAGFGDYAFREMGRGMKAAFNAAKTPLDPQNLIESDLTYKAGFDTVEALLARKEPPTALFCLSDLAAAGAMAAVLKRGIAPGAFSILGCSDDPICTQIHPTLSTVHLPAEELGVAALKDIQTRIRKGNLTSNSRKRLPATLVKRGSCAPLKKL